ncbi:MAG TPA: hypothetical protein H9991_10310 [Candidatus Mailhella excrementigallinarum]|nr:hypothetical protein [Candidatus Mailhella excrementigallinarum]
MPSVIIQGKPLKLAAPRGFVNIQAVAPALFEEYRRAQHVLALYIDSCHMGGTCQSPAELLDPFVEVLMPETGSFVRDMSREFFESCKFEVEQSILGSGWASLVPSESGSPRPQGRFSDGPGWFSCCTLRYSRIIGSAEKQKDKDAFVPSIVGNIVFLVREHPVIVNLHRTADPVNPQASFDWLTRLTRDYRGLLLRLNGIV